MPETPLHDDVAYWLDEIKACREREADFRKDGQRICEIYEANQVVTIVRGWNAVKMMDICQCLGNAGFAGTCKSTTVLNVVRA